MTNTDPMSVAAPSPTRAVRLLQTVQIRLYSPHDAKIIGDFTGLTAPSGGGEQGDDDQGDNDQGGD